MALSPEVAAIVTKAVPAMPAAPTIETGIFAAGLLLMILLLFDNVGRVGAQFCHHGDMTMRSVMSIEHCIP